MPIFLKKYLLKTFRLLAWLAAIFVTLFIFVAIMLMFPRVQTFITGKITSAISSTTGSEIKIERVAIRFPVSVGIRGVYVEDQAGDTLLYAGSLFVNIRMTALLRNQVHIRSIELSDLTASLRRIEPGGEFNWQFLADSLGQSEGEKKNGDMYAEPPLYDKNGQPETPEERTVPVNGEPEGNPMDIVIDRVILNNIKFTFDDHHSGLYLKSEISRLRTTLRYSDILRGKYHAGKTELTGSTIELHQYEPSVPREPREQAASLPDIWIESLSAGEVAFSQSRYDGTGMSIEAGSLSVVPHIIDLGSRVIDISSVGADNLHALIINPSGEDYGTGEDGDDTTDDTDGTEDGTGDFRFVLAETIGWSIGLGSLEIENSGFSIRPEDSPGYGKIFDPGNFSLDNMTVSAENIYAGPDRLRLRLKNLSTLVSDQFLLKQLSLETDMGNTSGMISAELVSAQSRAGLIFKSGEGFLDLSSDNLYRKRFDLAIENTLIMSDLAFFLPLLNSYYFNWPESKGIEVNGMLHGSLSDLTADSLRISGPGFFSLAAAGDITGLPHSDSLYIDISNFSLNAMPDQFFSNLHDSLRPPGITMPAYIDVDGYFSGTLKDFETAIDLKSEFGDIAIMASMFEEDVDITGFEGRLLTSSFDAGRLLQLEVMPLPPSVDLTFAGRGTDPAGMEMEAEIDIGNLTLMEYPYDDIKLQLSLKDSVANISGDYRDDFLSFNLNAGIGLFTEILFAKGGLTIEYADLKQLGITEDEFLAGTAIETDILFYPRDFFTGNINISNTNIATGDGLFNLPGMNINSQYSPNNYLVEINSGFITANYEGNFAPFAIPGILEEHLSGYFSIADTLDSPDSAHRFFDMKLVLAPDELVNMVLLPGIEKYDTLNLTVSYDSRLHSITLNGMMDYLRYTGTEITGFSATATSDPSKMDFGVSADRLGLNETEFQDFSLSGGFMNDILDLSLSLKDDKNEDVFFIRALAESSDDLYLVRIESERLVINREEWTVNPGNLIVTGKDSLYISQLVIENLESMLSVNSRFTDEHNTVIDVNFRDMDIYRLTSFVEKSIPVTGGTINGDLILRDVTGEPSFLADMTVGGLTLTTDTIDLIKIKAENPEPGIYNVSLSLEQDGTALYTAGSYTSGEDPGLDIDVLLEKLNLSLIENFTGGNITHLEGFVTGKMKVTGRPDNPELTGELNISETSFRVPSINAGYFLRKESIRFDRQNVHFRDFTLRDSLGRTAQVNGSVNIANFSNIILNLNLSTRNFLIMNLPQRRDELYHGRILIDTDLRLRGNHLNPSLEGNLKLNEGSVFTLILPQADPEAIGDEGVVEFIAPGDTLFFRMAERIIDQDDLVSSVERMDINLNVELDRQTEIKLIIDDLAGDFLELKGGGVLSLGIDPGGTISLSGRYEIVEGAYLLTFYDVIRRNFAIRPGSSIVWSGDPLDAQLDITAIYTARTGARELMRTHTGADQVQAARLRQQYPFLVYLKMSDNLMNPDISFELDMPPEHQSALDGSVMARINEINLNESELNKQVFALLILGSFIQENPLDFAGGPGLSSTARSSGSQILSQQLNRMSDRYIRGLDINFELESYEDYTEGQAAGRTELQMEVSRNFLDERMRITVGGNIELEDETQRQTGASDIAGDFSIEYLLTPEGNLIIKGFRNRDYGDLIEGDVTETGVSLVFSRSYNRFRELFRRREEEQPLSGDQQEEDNEDEPDIPEKEME